MENEQRLIKVCDATAVYNGIALYMAENAYLNDTALDVLKMVAKWLDEAPTVDAVEVVHGRWILEQKFADGTADYKCSACDYDDTFHCNLVNAFYKYCPYCGAKMDGGNEDG